MKVQQSAASGDHTIINFGPILRRDPRSTFRLIHFVVPRLANDEPGEPIQNVEREGPIPDKGRMRLLLPLGERYLIIAQGVEVAGVVHTAQAVLTTPFHVTIDAPPSQVRAIREQQKQQDEAEKRRTNPVAAAVHHGLNGQGK